MRQFDVLGRLARPAVVSIAILMILGCASQSPIQNDFETTPKGSKGSVASGAFSIPAPAKLIVQSHGVEPGQFGDYDAEFCKAHQPTEAEIRQQFQIARRLEGRDLHDDYVWTPCYTDGVIVLEGRTMKWRFRVGNVIETTYPDGQPKTLGGEPSDSP